MSFSFFIAFDRIVGEMLISLIWIGGVAAGRRGGKGGSVPLSLVKTDSKKELSRSAFSESEVISVPLGSQSGDTPDPFCSLLLTNL